MCACDCFFSVTFDLVKCRLSTFTFSNRQVYISHPTIGRGGEGGMIPREIWLNGVGRPNTLTVRLKFGKNGVKQYKL